MIVMKFGGTSVANAQKIRNLYDIVMERVGCDPIIVVSAMAGVTDMLLELPRTRDLKILIERHREALVQLGLENGLLDEVFGELGQALDRADGSARSMDGLVSFGEVMSSRLIAAYFNARGTSAQAYTGWGAGIITDSTFGNAEVQLTENKIKNRLGNLDLIPIIAGFTGMDRSGAITTLGRGGSDYTAALIGAAMGVSEIQIWTDVNGVMTTDPAMVASARSIPEISFMEASELSYFGAKVLHPKTIHPAVKKNIPVRILSTANPGHKGTIITSDHRTDEKFTAISFKRNVTVVKVYSARMLLAYGFLARVFDVFDRFRTSIDMISTSEVSISMTLDNTDNLARVVEALKQYGKVETMTGKALICVVGASIIEKTNVAGKVFGILGEKNINIEMISQGASPVSLAFLVNDGVLDAAVNILHKRLFEGEK